MKNKKLNLTSLKVQSFVTKLDDVEGKNTVKGGNDLMQGRTIFNGCSRAGCNTKPFVCEVSVEIRCPTDRCW